MPRSARPINGLGEFVADATEAEDADADADD